LRSHQAKKHLQKLRRPKAPSRFARRASKRAQTAPDSPGEPSFSFAYDELPHPENAGALLPR
jgi:hypothetical protein